MSLTELPLKKFRLLEACLDLMSRQGYAATTVDQICKQADVTKGSFFYYFPSKEDIGTAVIEFYVGKNLAVFAEAKLDEIVDPVERVVTLFDLMIEHAKSRGDDNVCIVGMMAQELSKTHEGFREACETQMCSMADMVCKILSAAAESRGLKKVDFDPESLSWFVCSVMQGSMLVSKTRNHQAMTIDNVQHCRWYVEGLIQRG